MMNVSFLQDNRQPLLSTFSPRLTFQLICITLLMCPDPLKRNPSRGLASCQVTDQALQANVTNSIREGVNGCLQIMSLIDCRRNINYHLQETTNNTNLKSGLGGGAIQIVLFPEVYPVIPTETVLVTCGLIAGKRRCYQCRQFLVWQS